MTKRTWVQTKNSFVEVFRQGPQASVAPAIHLDIKPFRSPIDGSKINTRAQLRAHNAHYGVSNDLDSLREKTDRYMKNKDKERSGSKKERINALVEAYDRVSTPGFGRREQFHEDKQLQ